MNPQIEIRPERRVPYVLTEAGRAVTDQMRAQHPPSKAAPTRKDRRWALTDKAIALLDSEQD